MTACYTGLLHVGKLLEMLRCGICILCFYIRGGRDSSVGIATRYGLNGPGI